MTTVIGYRAPIARAPKGLATSTVAADNTHVSSAANTGPMIMNVARAVNRTVVSGVTNKSIISGTILCSLISILLITHTAITTGITCPW